jgi:hypothetical protein
MRRWHINVILEESLFWGLKADLLTDGFRQGFHHADEFREDATVLKEHSLNPSESVICLLPEFR